MAIRKQLSVTMENRPGSLAKMCSALGEKKVNILAVMSSSEREGQSVVRMIVDKLPVAKRVLQAIDYPYMEEQVLVTRIPNRPGTLATVVTRLGDAEVNIAYAYLGAEAGSRQQLVALSVSDIEQAKKLVK